MPSKLDAPVGQWTINANGWKGKLVITAIENHGTPSGGVRGTLDIDPPAGQARHVLDLQGLGLWNGVSKELMFMRVIDKNKPSMSQIYTGFMFPHDKDKPEGPSELAGFFEAFDGTGGSATRARYGWFANRVE